MHKPKKIGEIMGLCTNTKRVYGIPAHMFGKYWEVVGVSTSGNYVIKNDRGGKTFVPPYLVYSLNN